jgi:hypothetical protein
MAMQELWMAADACGTVNMYEGEPRWDARQGLYLPARGGGWSGIIAPETAEELRIRIRPGERARLTQVRHTPPQAEPTIRALPRPADGYDDRDRALAWLDAELAADIERFAAIHGESGRARTC